MDKYLPYLATIVCTIISGFASYLAARKQSKSDIQKLMKQHELDLETEREKFKMEKERMEIEHKQQMEQKIMEVSATVGSGFITTVVQNFMNSKAGEEYIQGIVNDKRNKK